MRARLVASAAPEDPGRPAAPSARLVDAVERVVRALYDRHEALPFHGWHHVRFVRDKSVEFARRNGSDPRLVAIAALVHDVNYIVDRTSEVEAGAALRASLLAEAGAAPELVPVVERIVCEADMATRHAHIGLAAQALSDADTLFKALPTTPVVLAHHYLRETGVGLRALANRIVGDQQRAYDAGFYFYDRDAAARYSGWAEVNLRLWSSILESLEDPIVHDLVSGVDVALAAR